MSESGSEDKGYIVQGWVCYRITIGEYIDLGERV